MGNINLDEGLPAEVAPLRVLVVDDDQPHAQAVAESLLRVQCECTIATSGVEGAQLIGEQDFDIVLTDLVMNEIDGFEILRRSKQQQPETEVILITGHGSIDSAVTAMQQGALTYLTKPLDLAELRTVVQKASRSLQLTRSNLELKRRLDEKFGFKGVVGSSPQMDRLISTLRQIAPTSATVLIQGESGTGKELVAQAINNNSDRKNKPFVALNCAALSESILESELFGHTKGAFTGAVSERKGRFEYANGGTLFLDEVGDMPMPTQIKLLRVIESREIMRVGSNEPVKVNVRLISATNADLEEAVSSGSFRKDLYYRLKVMTINIPPLRERRMDIPLLCDHFIREFSQLHNKQIESLDSEMRKLLMSADWPGNVRQLKNIIESMVVIDTDTILDHNDLPNPEDLGVKLEELPSSATPSALVGKSLDEVEKYFIAEALQLTKGNREEASHLLGIGERTLYRKIKQYQIN